MSGATAAIWLGVVGWLLLACTALALVPAVVLFCEVAAAALAGSARRREAPMPQPVPAVAVLMPAHDEASRIAASIHAVRAQSRAADRLLVVADNCTDDTAAVARAAGAEVVERRDPLLRGKGHALAFGLRHLGAAPPPVVVFLDADCLPGARAIETLARAAVTHGRPAQALYRMQWPAMTAGTRPALRQRLASFAWELRNHVRPLGAAALGAPCALFGTGMAFPWGVIRAAPVASGHLVEDLELGVALAAAGTPARFCPQAEVYSLFPADVAAARTQRTRWEQGHLALLIGTAPRQLGRALMTANIALAALMLDLLIPPLALLVVALAALVAIDGAWWWATHDAAPIAAAAAALALLTISVVVAWARYGRHIVSFSDLLRVPIYVAAKLPLYARMLARRQAEWIRTKRDEPHG